jgi:NAD(P)-dependent dehydrogenase (short-subunit alcohol dehydrogenase family)
VLNNAGVGMDSVCKDYLGNPPHFDDLSEELVRFCSLSTASRLYCCPSMQCGACVKLDEIVTTSNDSMMRPGFMHYGGTKASLEGHSATMAQELASTDITFNVLVPGCPADTGMILHELGFERSSLISPETMVPPPLWLLTDGPLAPNGKRVLSVSWTPEADASGDLSVCPIGWPGIGSKALIPAKA